MKSNFSSIAVAVRKNLVEAEVMASLGHVHQLLAAGLGYASYASYKASGEETHGLEGADYLILDVEGIDERATGLGYGDLGPVITESIVAVIKADPEPPQVFLDQQEFIDDVVCGFANDLAMNDDNVSNAAAETNAYFSDTSIEATEAPEPLKESREFWEVPIGGNVLMDQDEDKPFCGDTILVKGVVRIWKTGRVCLADDMELDIGAGVDDSYYESEPEVDLDASQILV